MNSVDNRWMVMKFGGTSVASPDRWSVIAELARARRAEGLRVFIVHSALSGVSNRLEALPDEALAGSDEASLEAVFETHRHFAHAAGLDADALIGGLFERARQLVAGVRLLGEASPRTRAELLALGELMSNALGAALLAREGLPVATLDSRDILRATDAGRDARAYLDVRVDSAPDAGFQASLKEDEIVLAPGFIASNDAGETVLLGRGGSDTSAAHFAAMLEAERLEIWTDVPGLFSADPRLTDGARLLTNLSYDEAQEIATMGGKVLHPRSIGPARRANVPVLVKDSFRPDLPGTRITAEPGDDRPRLKAVSVKSGVRLVVMEGAGMWRQVGFLADIFAAFKACGVSVDLVSTSETNVTVSLDPDPGLDAERLSRLRAALERHCRVRIIENAAAVSLVGYGVRRILHQLAPALEAFQDRPILLVSQAANDLNFSVVVDEDQGRPLAAKLHENLISAAPDPAVFGPSWAEITAPAPSAAPVRVEWWRRRRAELEALCPAEGGLYVYDAATIAARASALAALRSPARVFYAVKANNHPDVLRLIRREGLGFECVSMAEVEHALDACPDAAPADILFTPNFAPRSEYEAALARGVNLTIDGLHPLQRWPELFRDRPLLLRVNPDRPRGHHEHVKTAGPKAKFGIPRDHLAEARRLADAADARITGLHAHAGSGVTEADHWREMGRILAEAAEIFPEARVIDVGGGLGVPESPDDPGLDLLRVDAELATLRTAFPQFELWMEPGRYLVAESGVLLTRATQMKDSFGARFVGLSTGMNSLIRPALYGARHEIYNLTRLEEPAAGLASVVGPICESADLLGSERLLPETREGDVMLIADAGAYGAVMASRYNLRTPAGETVLE